MKHFVTFKSMYIVNMEKKIGTKFVVENLYCVDSMFAVELRWRI
jgi:hypothetical protein